MHHDPGLYRIQETQRLCLLSWPMRWVRIFSFFISIKRVVDRSIIQICTTREVELFHRWNNHILYPTLATVFSTLIVVLTNCELRHCTKMPIKSRYATKYSILPMKPDPD